MTTPDPRAVMLRDGFPGERLLVLPRPLVRVALSQLPTSQLLVTDSGYFPHAQHHGRVRDTPGGQAVVLICVKGRGWARTGSGTFEVHAGEVVVLPPHLPHAYGADEEEPWTLWWIHIAGDAVAAFIERAGASAATPVRVPPDAYGAALLVSEIVQWMEHDSTESSLIAASGAAWHLMSLLAASRPPSVGSHDSVERAAEYIRQHPTTRTSIPEMAATAGLSTSHFAALFKKTVGVPVAQYQLQVRMARARELLDTTGLPVATIAASVGFDDPLYFGRQFRKVHGLSPTAYRRQPKG